MQNVLIVDDEKNFLLGLSEGLSYHAGEFNVVTALNGKKAVEILKSMPVHLVLTDLKMPEMDGFELLAYISCNNPNIPVLVMTAFSNPEIKERLRALSINEYIEKPINYNALLKRILEELSSDSSGHIRGITLAAFMQLIEMERKTCILDVASAGKVGNLYFIKGELIEAVTGDKNGDAAAYEILCWDTAEIEIEPTCSKRKKNITLPLNHILMEAFRLKDERRTVKKPAGEPEEEVVFDFIEQDEELHLSKEVVMSLESHLQTLKEVKGYKASGIMNFTGEMLLSDSSDPNVDLGLVGATFNDIFRSAHEASKKIGLDVCNELVIYTPNGIIVMRCSGVNSKTHFHLISVLANDGNQALMKMQIEKLVPAIMAEL